MKSMGQGTAERIGLFAGNGRLSRSTIRIGGGRS
jgi:hypothetical protein